jgi:haloalkane dehalogenase
MRVLRTPDDRFEELPDFGYRPSYADVGGVQMAYVQAGPPGGEPVLLLHGDPFSRLVNAGCAKPLAPDVLAAYDAPFPAAEYAAGPRAMPGLVPTRPDDPASDANRLAWDRLTRWDKPFLVAFSDGDPITGGMAPILRRAIPGAAGIEHPVLTAAGHFLQEDAGDRLAADCLVYNTSSAAISTVE